MKLQASLLQVSRPYHALEVIMCINEIPLIRGNCNNIHNGNSYVTYDKLLIFKEDLQIINEVSFIDRELDIVMTIIGQKVSQ